MDDLYRENIIDHYKNPQYRGHLDTHQITFEDDNPLCGDHIHVEMQVNEDGVVTNAAFEGHGCAISQASADLLMETVIGMNVDEIKFNLEEGLINKGEARVLSEAPNLVVLQKK